MNAVVMQMFQPDIAAMAQHVEHLFGGFLDGYHDGKIELAWTDSKPDESGRYRLKNAAWFGTDQLEELVAEAARLNATPYTNVYIGAALRHPDTAPFGRSKNADAWALTAVYVDLDDPGTATKAKDLYAAAKPTMIVQTGREPHLRAQCWWRLSEPLTDPATWPSALRGLAVALEGDTTVTNPGRVMRLAGSIAWPVKEGRSTVEVTCIRPLKVPGQPIYSADHIASLFPPVAEAVGGGVDTSAAVVSQSTNGLGITTEKLADGRERYMLNTTYAVLMEYIGTNGCAPSAQELFGAAWPQYERGTDLSRPGRGQKEFAAKCEYTVTRFERGEIRGMRTLDETIDAFQAKQKARALAPKPAAESKAPLPPPARQDSGIATTSFLTLLTEDVVEEPDYIEPGFAGPGNFVLIAGPPKAQKSFLLQEMLVACATGSKFLSDTFNVPAPLKVFYLQAEMNRKLLRKRAREMKFLSPEQRQLLGTNLIVSERFHMILNEDGVKTAVETIKREFPDRPPDIIAIDPMANVFDQENENDNAQVMRFLTGRIEAVRQAVNPLACIVMVHHATKTKSEDMARDPFVAIRGAGSLRGYYDSAIVIFRHSEETKERKIHFELRGGESPEPITAELQGGRFQKAGFKAQIDKPVARQILSAIGSAWAKNEPWSMHPRAHTEGRYVVKNASSLFHVPEIEVTRLVEQWLLNGVVTHRDRLQRERPAGLQVTGSLD